MHGRLASTFLLVTLTCSSATAQDVEAIDLNALPLPLSTRPGSALEGSTAPEAGSFSWALRTSGLDTPISLRLPSPDPEGSTVHVVEGVVMSELSAIVALPEGWDVGIAFGTHMHQSGAGVGGDGQVAGFGARDPRMGFGWSFSSDALRVRPFAQLHVPIGNKAALAGEKAPRGKAGVSFSTMTKIVQWSTELSFLYRPKIELSSTTFGPQLIGATGVVFHLGTGFNVGTEFIALPVLAKQESRSGQPGGALVPSEALLNGSYTTGAWSFGVAFGTGVPLSRSSAVHTEPKYVRGPTSPLLRGLVDVRFEK